jgi:hypothetical protein
MNVNKLDEVIGKFNNGQHRYQNSAITNKVIQSLANGGDPYTLIDELCQIIDNHNEQFSDYVSRDTRPITILIDDKKLNI